MSNMVEDRRKFWLMSKGFSSIKLNVVGSFYSVDQIKDFLHEHSETVWDKGRQKWFISQRFVIIKVKDKELNDAMIDMELDEKLKYFNTKAIPAYKWKQVYAR